MLKVGSLAFAYLFLLSFSVLADQGFTPSIDRPKPINTNRCKTVQEAFGKHAQEIEDETRACVNQKFDHAWKDIVDLFLPHELVQLPFVVLPCVDQRAFLKGFQTCTSKSQADLTNILFKTMGIPSSDLARCTIPTLVQSFSVTLNQKRPGSQDPTSQAVQCAEKLNELVETTTDQAKEKDEERAEEKAEDRIKEIAERDGKPLLEKLKKKAIASASKSLYRTEVGRRLVFKAARVVPLLSKALSTEVAASLSSKVPQLLAAAVVANIIKLDVLLELCMSESASNKAANVPIACNRNLCTCYDTSGSDQCMSPAECTRVYGPNSEHCMHGSRPISHLTGSVLCSNIQVTDEGPVAPLFLGDPTEPAGKMVSCRSYARLDEMFSKKRFCYIPTVNRPLKTELPPPGGRRVIKDRLIVGYEDAEEYLQSLLKQARLQNIHSPSKVRPNAGSAK